MIDLGPPPFAFPRPAIVRPAPAELLRHGGDPAAASFLPGTFPAGAVARNAVPGPTGVIEFSHTDQGSDANTNSFSVAGLSAGTETTWRYLIALITTFDNDVDNTPSLSSLTIGGEPATIVESAGFGLSNPASGLVAIGIALVPLGTTVTVEGELSFSGTMDSINVALFRAAELLSPTPVVSASDSGLTPASAIDTSGCTFVLCAASDNDNDPGTLTGGGNPTTVVNTSREMQGYDDAPTGGSTTYEGSGQERGWVVAAW